VIWLSVLIWCAAIAATADFVRRSIRLTETIDRDHPELWERVHFRRWAPDPTLAQQTRQLIALIFVGFPREAGTRYPELKDPLNRCRDSAVGLAVLLAVAIASMTLWPKP
jgi:hypothetical protein